VGTLDQGAFEQLVQGGCTACSGKLLEIRSYIDCSVELMAGDPTNDGRFVHDGEKFVDGTYNIACVGCKRVLFASDVCPRCNTPAGLEHALLEETRLRVPKRCPHCDELELMMLAFVPASARFGGESSKPKPLVDYGDPGYHVVAYACHHCDNAIVAERCPLCDAPGPLRQRP